jgi:hypothetical protein
MVYSPEDRRWDMRPGETLAWKKTSVGRGMKGCTETEKEQVGSDESRILSYASSYAVPRDGIADAALDHMVAEYR